MNIKRSVRLTRRSYRRKLVMFGVSIFMSLALVATGFAAWVLSKDAQKTANGEVEIGAVTESSVEMTDITFIPDNDDQKKISSFVFEPTKDDTNGRVRYDGSSEPENMDLTFTWTISNYQIVGDVFVEFKVPATVYKALDPENKWLALPMKTETTTGFELVGDEQINEIDYKVLRYNIQTADKLITASGATADGMVTYTVNENNSVTFVMTIAFEWGDAFKGDNPGKYYDSKYEDDPDAGAAVDFQTMKDTLNKFKATLHGIPDSENYLGSSEEDQAVLCKQYKIPNYYIVINANVA